MVIVHTKSQKEKSKVWWQLVSRPEQILFFFVSHMRKSWLHKITRVHKCAVKEKNGTSLCVYFLYLCLSLSHTPHPNTCTQTHTHSSPWSHSWNNNLKEQILWFCIYRRLIWHCAIFFGTAKLKLLVFKNQFRKLVHIT